MNTDAPRAQLLHPATRILLWVLLAVACGAMGWMGLTVASVLVAAALAGWRDRACLAMLRRARWLLLSLLLVYGFATSGPPLSIGAISLPLSRPGLEAGLLQAWRLVLMIAGLALLLALTSRPEMIGGIHAILSPLRAIGLDPDRAAVRLSLTLDYARALGRPRGKSWRQVLVDALEPDADPPSRVVIQRGPYSWRDSAAIAAAALVLVAAW